MILRLKKGLPAGEFRSIQELCEGLGYVVRVLDDDRVLLQLDGAGAPEHRSQFEDCPGVAQVIDPGEACELFARAPGAPDTVVRAAGAACGGGHVSIIAGPCAVEDEALLVEIARFVRREGATLLRGGAYKPRTSPYSFQGLGEVGLAMLARVRDEVGIGVVTEVLDTRDVERVARVADVLQIGARSMANYALLREVGRAERPVLLKRGFGATVRELLMAAEYILAEGCRDLVLCERGIRGFDDVSRNLLDVGAVAHLKRVTHLPIIVDPSHAAGRAELVRPLARAGLAAGADGLMVEVHPRPADARSDSHQAIDGETFSAIVRDVRAIAELDGRKLVLPNETRAQRVKEAIA